MASENWTTKPLSVASLHLDPKNPRLGRETAARAPREIIQYLFEHDKAMDVAESIATRGYFPNEPLLAIRENDRLIVVEGNRRLAALKALREPGLLEGAKHGQIDRLARRIINSQSISKVPVTIAPSRKATDRQIAGRHVGTPVLAWQAENRASFILDKLEEGYSNDDLRDELGFSLADIQEARQTRAIADMARSLPLEEEVKAKLDNPRAKVFSTIARVFDSTVGRDYFHIEKDSDHGIRGKTSKEEFVKAFTKLVSDIALGKESSRSLNNTDDIKSYFSKWKSSERPAKKKTEFVPSDVIKGKSVASSTAKKASDKLVKKSKQEVKTVLPRNLRVRHGTDRMIDIRGELTKLKRDSFPNAGAVLLRVFLELTAVDYLQRTGDLDEIIEKIGKQNLQFGIPTMRQMVPTLIKVAKQNLSSGDALKVEKAIKYDQSAPFTLSDLHAFVHQANDLPTPRDIWQFWLRIEPLLRLMLEGEDEGTQQ